MKPLTCFKKYDIRGKINENIDASIVYRISRAAAQHLNCKSVVIGYDARGTSPEFANAACLGATDAGSNVLQLGLAGTEEMYWAVTEYNACAGIMITASHNPIDYNGMKLIKSQSRPLDEKKDFAVIKKLAELQDWKQKHTTGSVVDVSGDAREKYIKKILSFMTLSRLKPLKIVINSGNGAAGPTVDAIIEKLKQKNSLIEFIKVNHEPDSRFPNGIPNPILEQNHPATADIVKQENADFGIAFDGDFDRCFFFDESGKFIPGEYLVGIFAKSFLEKNPGETIVHDPRVVWNTLDVVSKNNGKLVQSQTGHAYIKESMRRHNAIYGGEMSAHHYFRDFAFCDSGMIPWLLMTEIMSNCDSNLSSLIEKRQMFFPSSGEINFTVSNPLNALENVLAHFEDDALSIDKTDGISLSFGTLRFNLRMSNTEPLVRLNVESIGNKAIIREYIDRIEEIIGAN